MSNVHVVTLNSNNLKELPIGYFYEKPIRRIKIGKNKVFYSTFTPRSFLATLLLKLGKNIPKLIKCPPSKTILFYFFSKPI